MTETHADIDLAPAELQAWPSRWDRFKGPIPKLERWGAVADLGAITVILWAASTALKLWMIGVMPMLWDEAHFVVTGWHPALGYPDIPPGPAFLAWLSTTLFGASLTGLRIGGVILAQAIPLAVWFMARPLAGRRGAFVAAIISMLIPTVALNGVIFYPETGLQLLTALTVGCTVRAFRTGESRWWVATGLVAAVGLFLHYRFLLVGGGLLAALLLTRVGRWSLARPGVWIGGAIAMVGLTPALIDNVQRGFAPLLYQAGVRHVWGLSFEGATFLLQQAIFVTPLMFAVLGLALWCAVQRWRIGGEDAAPVVTVFGVMFGVYGVWALVDRQALFHWVFMAYVPLLAYAPEGFARLAPATGWKRWGLVTLAAIPAVVFAGVAMTMIHFWARPDQAPAWALSRMAANFEDWSRLDGALREARRRVGESAPIVATEHLIGLRYEFPRRGLEPSYFTAYPYDRVRGFDGMRDSWGQGERQLLAEAGGKPVVLITQQPVYLFHEADEFGYRMHLCSLFTELSLVSRQDLPPGRITTEVWTARVRSQPALRGLEPDPKGPCPLVPQVEIAQPGRGVALSDDLTAAFGIAWDPAGVARVEILIDGKPAGLARYGLAPKPPPEALKADPNYPRLSWDYLLDAGKLGSGAHTLQARAVTRDGRTLLSPPRTFYRP